MAVVVNSAADHRSAQPRRFDLVCFDLDGTLIPRTSVSLWLARRLGHHDMLQQLENRYRSGEISNSAIAEASARAYAGLRLSDIDDALAEIPLIAGVEPTIAALKNHRMKLLLTTVTWKFAARFYQRKLGFDAVSGTEMGEIDGHLTGEVTRHFDADAKAAFLRTYCGEHAVALDRCVAVGDSRSDLPLFATAGFTIALNGTDEVNAAADVSLQTDNLTEILPFLVDCSRD